MFNWSIRQQRSILPLLQRLIDGVTVVLTIWVGQIVLNHPDNPLNLLAGFAGALSLLAIGELTGIYRRELRRTPDQEVATILGSWGMAFLIVLLGGFLTRYSEVFPRSAIMGWAIAAGGLLAINRLMLNSLLATLSSRGLMVRRCAIAGINPLGFQLARNAVENPELGHRIVGFFDDRQPERLPTIDPSLPSFQGNVDIMIQMAKRGEVDTVFVTLPMRAESRIRQILKELGDTTVSVYIVPDFFVFEMLHSRWTQIGGLPAVSVFETPLYGVDGWSKRLLDLVVATAALCCISPIMLAVAIAIKATSPGPVFFRQKRYGLDGKEILVWKFRSMRTTDNGPKVQQATKGDPRITKVGAFIRRTSLDELPQLFNVIEGTMSLVGPRPHATAHNEHYRSLIPGYMLRHKVRPGITGLAQVHGCRGETETLDKMERRIEFDHRYIREWSLLLDIKIMIKTVKTVMQQENAY